MSVRRETMTGLERARQRRRHRSMAVLIVAGILVLAGFGLSLAYFSGALDGDSEEAQPTCTPTTSTPPQAKFTVNIYNSSGKSGAASDLSQAFKSRGFSLGSVGNDPYKKKLRDSGEIRYGSDGEDLAKRYVAPLVPGAKLKPDGRTGTAIDVAIGGETKPVATASETTDADGC